MSELQLEAAELCLVSPVLKEQKEATLGVIFEQCNSYLKDTCILEVRSVPVSKNQRLIKEDSNRDVHHFKEDPLCVYTSELESAMKSEVCLMSPFLMAMEIL
ncbi:hypothetical protein U9M48_001113 [Paspalum notatum var. saurae]|uniref:Uncharacterized protein n=1 Tax=Paspalum notatum var. saurae TaxID=547442 RepID=A0AAQ3PFI6_PASNO